MDRCGATLSSMSWVLHYNVSSWSCLVYMKQHIRYEMNEISFSLFPRPSIELCQLFYDFCKVHGWCITNKLSTLFIVGRMSHILLRLFWTLTLLSYIIITILNLGDFVHKQFVFFVPKQLQSVLFILLYQRNNRILYKYFFHFDHDHMPALNNL